MREIGPNKVQVPDLTEAQKHSLENLCERYNVPFRKDDYTPAFDLPEGYVSGWIGGLYGLENKYTIFVGCDPDGRISS